jgi:hypothetical protein
MSDGGSFFSVLLFFLCGFLGIMLLKSLRRNEALSRSLDNQTNEMKNLTKNFESASSQLRSAKQELEIVSHDLSTTSQALNSSRLEVQTLESQVNRLSKFSEVADAHDEAERLKSEARAQAKAAREQAQKEVKAAKDHAHHLIEDAKSKTIALLKEANEQAVFIAGDALAVRNDARKYENIVAAMKNRIEGYGNAYIVPSISLLDDLAESYGFAEAGVELKKARERARKMVRSREAAECDYVEANRKTTAVDFVVDAFNGKVDSILSRVKHDNVGTLTQEIKDAFTLVNHNGSAFRQARITQSYLKVRLEELKWAAIVQEIKLRDQEEQRRIREQIREEEKARKEFERAMKEAEKEEESIKKAIDKVLRDTEKATAEQREQYESQLALLSEKLRMAEEKNQRALSMAQQTRAGHVYVISNIGSFGEQVLKIGMTRRLEPLDRVRELGDASVPFPFDVHAMIYSEDAPALEKNLHTHFIKEQVNKINPRKEFFRAELKWIREAIEKLGVNASWTMTAEAREYRESLALEKSIAENPVAAQEWARHQEEAIEQTATHDEEEEPSSILDKASVGARSRGRRVTQSVVHAGV